MTEASEQQRLELLEGVWDLRVCRGNAGTLFALTRRHDLNLADLLLTPQS